MNDDGMKNSLIVSAIMHLAGLLFLYFGLPHLMPPLPQYHPPVSFQIVEIADMTNTKAKDDEQPKPPEPEPPKPQPKPEQTMAPPPPPPEVAKPQPDVEALKAAPPVPKPKPKVPDAKPQTDEFNKLLKNLEAKKTETQSTPETKTPAPATAQPAKPHAAPLSEMETRTLQDAIRSQIRECWNMPIGARDAQNLIVELGIDLNADGTVVNTDIVDKGRYGTDTFFRAAADSAVRAVRNPKCSPLRLPPDKYDAWKHIDFMFDPRDML